MLPALPVKAVKFVSIAAEVIAFIITIFLKKNFTDEPNVIIVPSSEDKPVPKRKHDTTKFTQYHYDFIVQSYEEFVYHNAQRVRSEHKTQKDLTDALNKKLNLNKSSTSYARVWNGKVDRESLPVGNQQDLFNQDTV